MAWLLYNKKNVPQVLQQQQAAAKEMLVLDLITEDCVKIVKIAYLTQGLLHILDIKIA